MNDEQIHKLWVAVEKVMQRVLAVERRQDVVDAHIRDRLKEEADAREATLGGPFSGPTD